jgi:hypothetical protein
VTRSLAEQGVSVLRPGAVVIGPARHEGLEEFRLELGRGRHRANSVALILRQAQDEEVKYSILTPSPHPELVEGGEG